MIVKRMSIRVYSLKKTPTIQALAFTPNLFRVRHDYLLTGCLVGKIPLLESIELFAKKKANRKFKVQIDTSKYCVHILMYTLPSMSKLDSIGVVLVPGAGHCCGQGKVTSAGAGQSPVSSPAERWSRDSKLVLHCREQRSPDSHNTTTTTTTTLHLYSTPPRKIQQLFT